MGAQKGKDLLLKVQDTPTTFMTVGGLRTRAIAFTTQTVDVTNQESAGRWRELLSGAGEKTAKVTGTGIFKDAASDALIRQTFFDGLVRVWQMIIPDFGTVQGSFQITALEFHGQHDGEVTFDVALESAGELSFIAL
jgi:TP901-1 family phage major tail protein